MPIIIKKVNAADFLGLSAVTIEPKQPIVLVSGGNAAGKTSLYQAIRLALFDEIPRVDLKKEAHALIREGTAKGSVRVETNDFGTERTYSVALPSRNRTGDTLAETSPMLNYCLDPYYFLNLDGPERLKLLLKLSGVRMTPDTIAERLLARNIPAPIVSDIKPLLTLGFDKCVAHAKEQASQARGAWKQLTGEVYGSVKAAHWKPAKPEDLPEPPIAHADAVDKHAKASNEVARLEGLQATAKAEHERRRKDRDVAPTVAELRTKVATLMTTANGSIEPATLECPKCNESLVLADGKLEIFKPQALAYVSPSTKAKAAAELAAAKRDLAAAEGAVARIAAETDLPAIPTDEAVQTARDALADAAATLTSLSTAHERYAAAVAAQTRAEAVEKSAKARHADVEAWDGVADALSPGGIPSELTKQAMAPLRDALRDVTASTHVKHWPQPHLSDEGAIWCDSRSLALMSESEQWRVGVLYAAALARLTKLGIIAMDRADVLSPAERSSLIGWLFDMVDPEAGEAVLAQAWVFCTTKTPLSKSDAPIEEYRLQSGALA